MSITMTGNGVRTREVSLAEYQNLLDGKDNRLVRLNPETSTSFIADTDLYREAWIVQNSIVDRYVPADTLSVEMAVDIRQDSYRAVPLLSVGGELYSFTTTSFGQLCEKSGMGVTSYMKKCITNRLPHLVPQNLNAWLKAQGSKELLVRFHKNEVIAFLSNKYGVFDHGDALDCLSNALGKNSTYRIEAHALDVDNLSVRLVDTEKFLVQDASGGRDKSTAGLVFRNGQTGRSLASIEFMIYTFACTNGLVVAQDRGIVYKRRHISINKEEFTEQITATLEQFPDYVETARKDMEQARQVRISVEMRENLRKQIQKGLSVGEDTVNEIFEVMDTQWDANAWGIAGAITEVAQKFSADRQYQFEKYAGELVKSLAA